MKLNSKIITILLSLLIIFSSLYLVYADNETQQVDESNATFSSITELDKTNDVDDELSKVDEDNEVSSSPAESDKTDGISVIINNIPLTFKKDEGLPYIENDRIMLPMRKIANALNSIVAWRQSDKTIHILKNGVSLMFTIDSPVINKQEFKFDGILQYTCEPYVIRIDEDNDNVVPIISNEDNRSYLPLRALCERLGAVVSWEGNTKTAYVTIEQDDNTDYFANDAAKFIQGYNYIPEVIPGKLETVTGCVYENVSGVIMPIQGAVVKVGDEEKTTNRDGIYEFKNSLGIGRNSFSVIKRGYTMKYPNEEKIIWSSDIGEKYDLEIYQDSGSFSVQLLAKSETNTTPDRLSNVDVSFAGKTAKTDSKGICTFEDVSAGTYIIEVKGVNPEYKPKSTTQFQIIYDPLDDHKNPHYIDYIIPPPPVPVEE